MGRRTQTITVSAPERALLNVLARSRTEPFHLVQRAKLILKAAEGEQNQRIGAELGLHPRHVKTWRVRWHDATERLRLISTEADLDRAIRAVLSDRPRPGCPPTFSAEQMCRIIELACRDPREFERPVSHWTAGDLAREAIRQGIVPQISARTVGRFLKGGRASTPSHPLLAAP
jgi:hypothetical protein